MIVGTLLEALLHGLLGVIFGALLNVLRGVRLGALLTLVLDLVKQRPFKVS